MRDLVHEAASGEPAALSRIYGFVAALRPGTARETVRARVYEAIGRGTMQRLAEGVYIAVGDSGSLVMVEGDAWESLSRLDSNSVNVLLTDPPYDLGTAQNARVGTTRPHGVGGRDYEQRDLDEGWLRDAFRILKKSGHAWQNLRTGEAVEGPGALVFFTPKLTRQTRVPVMRLLMLAERVGFVYQGETTWDKVHIGAGYAFGRSRSERIHLLTAGERSGVGWDLGMPDVLAFPRVGNPTGGEEHEAEKPVGLFLSLLRFVARPGDVVFDPFAGRARWAAPAAREGFHVVLGEVVGKWLEEVAGDWQKPVWRF